MAWQCWRLLEEDEEQKSREISQNVTKDELHPARSGIQQIYQLSRISGCPLALGMHRRLSELSQINTVVLGVVIRTKAARLGGKVISLQLLWTILRL